MRLDPAAADALLDAFTATLSGGYIAIYSGPRPKSMIPTVQERLVTFPLPSPAFLQAANGSALGAEVPLAIIDESGEAVWAQFLDAAGAILADGSVGTEPGNDIVMARTDLQANGTIELIGLTIRLPLGER